MHALLAWSGFLGAWLLFAGPIYQAALELREQDFQRDEIVAAGEGFAQPPRVSAWWWLLPPVKYILERRRSRAFQLQVLHALTARQLEGMVTYLNKANGWFLVGSGGFLIAVKETGELVENYERWPTWAFWLLAAAMTLLSVGYVLIRMRRGADLISTAGGADAASRDTAVGA